VKRSLTNVLVMAQTERAKMELKHIKEKYDIQEGYTEDLPSYDVKNDSGIVLVVGCSGSGKSTILRKNGMNNSVAFDEETPIIEMFDSVEQGEHLLLTFGLRSIPTWFRTLNTVSNGERHRAECALSVSKGELFIDEFTSVVDRNTAKSLSVAVRKQVDNGLLKKVVIASCHRDIIDWLQPNVIYDTDARTETTRGVERRPVFDITISASSVKDWVYFKNHHYLDGNISKSCHCYTAFIDGKPVAFLAMLHRCGRDIHSYWGESRLVVLPEFQGLGIGYKLSEAIAEEYTSRGLRYFSKTAHPALGEKRDVSERWRATSTNRQKRRSYLKKDGTARKQKGFGKTEKSVMRDYNRICYSHEFIK
jgi:ABC-type lipoprotein export system ATPase subunit/GNAT superfamily N-acetyltransferase